MTAPGPYPGDGIAASEADIATWACEIIDGAFDLTTSENQLLADARAQARPNLPLPRRRAWDGSDQMGEEFIRLRSAQARRERGAIYTPPEIVEAMIEWASREGGDAPARIADPGAGSGRFLLAAAAAFPKSRLIGIEIDPLAALILRANAVAAGIADRLTVHVGDYQTFALPPIRGRTLFIGNPPYVRHHGISAQAKHWFAAAAARAGIKASKLAGLHIHFFMRTRELARDGDYGAFITSAEWLDVNYGSALRSMLANGLGGTALTIFDPASKPFIEAMTTGVIACFRVGNRPAHFSVRTINAVAELKPLGGGREFDWATVESTSRWSHFVQAKTPRPPGSVELGELFRVHRGQVTGCNAVWIAGDLARDLPKRFLFPAVTRARELFDLQGAPLDDKRNLRRVIDLPADLSSLAAEEFVSISAFFAWAKSQNAHLGFVSTHRRAWWSVGLREPPPILCTYMARRAPVFVRNIARASYLNIAHGLYPRQPMGEAQIAGILNYLSETVGTEGGRTYAGGLVKYEPGEVERLLIPDPATLTTQVSDENGEYRASPVHLDCRPARRRRATVA